MPVIRKATAIVWGILTLVVGAPLLLAPGRFLNTVTWDPGEPILNRILGAALLALSWASWRAWRSSDKAEIGLAAQAQAIFCALGAVGVLRHLLTGAYYPPLVWAFFLLLALFAVLWIAVIVTGRERA
jgi:hypothetical protein